MSKFSKLAQDIVQQVGGKDNISHLTHCMTRLRFDLKDMSVVNEEALKSHPQVISTAHAAGKLQVIIGNSVADVYDEIKNELGNINQNSSPNDTKEGIITKLTNTITKIITPTLGVLVAAGLLKGLLALLSALQVLSATSGTYVILNALGDALFYFFPIILGYTSAETFGVNKFVGMVLGGTLIYPGVMESMMSGDVIVSIFTNTAFQMDAFTTFGGIPVFFPQAGYASTVIPIILITYFASYVEKALKRVIPDIVGFAFVPFLTLLICSPIAFLVIGPIANFASSIIGWITASMLDISPVLAAIVVAMIYQPLVIFGLHWPLITIAITNFTTIGYDFLWPMMFTASFAQTAVVMAVGLRTKNKNTKAMTLPAIISGLMCIIEPAIYGFSLPDKKRFLFSCIGGAAGGVIITVFNAVQYNLGIGLLGFSGFIAPDGSMRNVIIAAIGTVVTMVIAFVLTYITFSETETTIEETTTHLTISTPVSGQQIDITEVEDKTFSSEVLGKSIAIKPDEGKVVAPFDGTIVSLFPTGHAIGLRSDLGDELMIHVGIDTVNLEGEYFTKYKAQGDVIVKGEVIVEFDIKAIEEKGYNTTTIVTLLNSERYQSIHKKETPILSSNDVILEVS
ncbi:MAG: PTS transporter subunit EIIC [Erysipelothrix sp.]|nr:PTS transporter subunit EIIC [Erysipelothrix sp.]